MQSVVVQKRIPKRKVAIFERLVKALREYRVVAVADLRKVRSSQIQEIRKKLRGRAELIVAKRRIFQKATAALGEEGQRLREFADTLSGPLAFLFSNEDPFSLALFLRRNKVRIRAKGGDVATNDIIIPAGNTGIPPGPAISEFSALKVPTKIEAGSIHVVRDTVVAKSGDVISDRLASLLSRLGLKPIEVGLTLIAAYEGGLIFTREDLEFDVEALKGDILKAREEAMNLAINAAYLTPETAALILSKAQSEAMALAIESEYPATPDALAAILQRAHSAASSLEVLLEGKT
ncbi:MAG: 50S ribosomal protein L10 [Candidatus Bathyarchaeia archaeon]